MGLKKYLITLVSILWTFSLTYGVQIVEVTQKQLQEEAKNETIKSVLTWIISLVFIGLLIAVVFGIVMWIIFKIMKMIQDYNRKKKDFLYYDFEQNNIFCNNNRDYQMKRRKKRTLWLTWKRSPIYLNTSNGLQQIGEYNGETLKKESFYMISVYNKLSMFKTFEYIIMIPLALSSQLVKKSVVNKQKVIIIECEGLDEVGSTDYYMLPLIPDPNAKGRFIDFSDLVRKDYTEKVVLRNEVKELLIESRDAVIKAVESNPHTQFNRRVEK